MKIKDKPVNARFAPLDRVTLEDVKAGYIIVKDGHGREYVRLPARSNCQFVVAGGLGNHIISLENPLGEVIETLSFVVKAQTAIDDQDKRFQELLRIAYYAMVHPTPFHSYDLNEVYYHERVYLLYACWLRYQVYTLKGMKYFGNNLKDGIDLYRDSQRNDGMIWDNVYAREIHDSYWDIVFSYDNFIQPAENHSIEFRRVPIENDTEYMFVEGLYYTWKAVGDDEWMLASLDAAIRALEYSITSAYRWSSKYQLLKRGYTIDTWDFQMESEYAGQFLADAMHADPEKTRFGVMFGDNTGYAAACRYLAEMLEYAGRIEDARVYRKRGEEIQERVKRLSWNGRYYTHHVPEDPTYRRDLGVDEASQVSFSNAFSLNRGIPHEQCVQIIQTYQELQARLPSGSPGEWYMIYPPFPKGFSDVWQFVNGGVSPLVAGELARGAFQHGFERYGANILERVYQLSKRHRDRLYGAYAGAIPDPPVRAFAPLDISAFANIGVSAEKDLGFPGWTGEKDNDMAALPNGYQVLADIPFVIPDPETNGGRGCIGLSVRDGYARRVVIPVGAQARCVYFLHASSHTRNMISGTITLHYADGSVFSQHVVRGRNVDGWWMPHAPDAGAGQPVTAVAWRGRNKVCPNIGAIAYGLNNPYPELSIERITLSSAEDGAFWAVLAITLSDQPAYFKPEGVSFGIPDGCAGAAVTAALVEGLAGVQNEGIAYRSVTLAPRWPVADVQQVQVSVCYPESEGYVAYRYHHHAAHALIEIELTGSGDVCHCHVLLPAEAKGVQAVRSGDQPLGFLIAEIEQSRYVDFTVSLPGPHTVKVIYGTAVPSEGDA